MNIVMSKSTTYSLESPKDPVLPSSFFTKPDKVGDSWLIPFKNGMIKGFLNLLDFDAGCPSRIYLRKKSVFILSFENFFILFSVFLFVYSSLLKKWIMHCCHHVVKSYFVIELLRTSLVLFFAALTVVLVAQVWAAALWLRITAEGYTF